ncbi:MAG TPA: uracil-DNA glycosylase [Xanthomonadales bacterium]|nr:uracil-DNA glycosylase [Xanthomonadales bacterium]
MNKKLALGKIAKEIEKCKTCIIGKSGMSVPGEGNSDADILFIGEAPGKKEAASGRPFIGRSGQLLRSLIREVGLKEEDVFITSPVKYLPNGPDGTPGGTPKPSDVAHGRIHLMKQFDIIQPKIVVLLGAVASLGVLEMKIPVKSEHGKVIEKDGLKYLVTLHPAAALRFPPLKLLIKEDFEKLKKIILSKK